MKFKIGDKVLYENKKYIVGEVDEDGYVITDDEGYSRWAYGSELELIKPTIDDLRDYMLEHFVDESGDLEIDGLDFSDFEGSVFFVRMKVGGDLSQSNHEVYGSLYQNGHKVDGNLYQCGHKVGLDYTCIDVEYGRELLVNEPKKVLKKISREELAELGYYLDV